MDDAYVIEAQLLRWNEGPSGRTVTFLLPEDGASHPFKGVKAGPSNGQRLALSIALINDHEEQQPLEQPAQATEKPADEAKPKGGPLARKAGILCGTAPFRRYLMETHGLVSHDGGLLSEESAAAFVRWHCGVDSRAAIDGNPDAERQWDELHSSFIAWREAP